ncbi:hypothetical protein PsAD2_03410 [Pseudovibrio axinellae]|uniref:Uncharacterized protein n=1 Tax=Pseudovibrio axinellae TaxID=989403 RepID=A0A165WQI5_9HYPH|nr:hypothetical protein [Pseudovibrio axinellae]KZL16793.1 hypothetical protein PsAD2_03410 [Pseudovibrio axinellae]SEQ74391.1 hypothetical protein SAMN05421798_104100 [Pseudovibrio axinellae]
MRKIKPIGTIEAIFVWGFFIVSILLYFALGGVVVAEKYEYGKYLISLRKNPSAWVETNAFLYYANLAKPWIFLSVIAGVFLSLIIKNKIWTN